MTTRIFWKDGARWDADDPSFDALLRQLDAARDVIVGLDPIVDRLHALSVRGPVLIDDLAPNEAERAVLTAAVHRCVDDLDALSDEALGLDGAEARTRYRRGLLGLRELVQTDVTW